MDSHSIGLIIALIVLVALSAFFSATETAYMSLNRVRIKNMANDGDRRARRVMKLLDSYDRLLATVLIGNNIVNIASASIATVLFVGFFKSNGATVSTVVMTVVVLIFGEITPKSLAKEAADSFVLKVSGPVTVLNTLFFPLSFLLIHLKGAVSRLIRVEKSSGMTEDELLTLVDEAEQDGGIDSGEKELFHNVIEFTDLDAGDILTPRIDVVAIDMEETPKALQELFEETGFSRIPVYRDTIDNIVGVVNEKDFHRHLRDTENTIESILQPALFIPASVKISELLKRLQQEKVHIAVVVDEFGGTEGIVTIEDIVEELVGEIWDEHDTVAAEIREIGKDTFAVPAATELSEFFERFGVEEETEVSTVNGWVTAHIGKIPAVGDTFDFENLTVRVTATDEQRASEIEVTVHEKPETEA